MTAYGAGVSDSDLHVTYTDPVSGGQALSQTFVAVEKV
jgi:thiosulfate reductase/polysulfide reductase chain A